MGKKALWQIDCLRPPPPRLRRRLPRAECFGTYARTSDLLHDRLRRPPTAPWQTPPEGTECSGPLRLHFHPYFNRPLAAPPPPPWAATPPQGGVLRDLARTSDLLHSTACVDPPPPPMGVDSLTRGECFATLRELPNFFTRLLASSPPPPPRAATPPQGGSASGPCENFRFSSLDCSGRPPPPPSAAPRHERHYGLRSRARSRVCS